MPTKWEKSQSKSQSLAPSRQSLAPKSAKRRDSHFFVVDYYGAYGFSSQKVAKGKKHDLQVKDVDSGDTFPVDVQEVDITDKNARFQFQKKELRELAKEDGKIVFIEVDPQSQKRKMTEVEAKEVLKVVKRKKSSIRVSPSELKRIKTKKISRSSELKEKQAIAELKAEGHHPPEEYLEFEETSGQYRFRLEEPEKFESESYRSIQQKEGDVQVVIAKKKGKETTSAQSIRYKKPVGKDSVSREPDFRREVDFEHDLKREYDEINFRERGGGMVRIPDLVREMEKEGYSKREVHEELLRMEKERIIELQIASQPAFIPEEDRELGIAHPSRGHINYVIWRKQPTTKAEVSQKMKQPTVEAEVSQEVKQSAIKHELTLESTYEPKKLDKFWNISKKTGERTTMKPKGKEQQKIFENYEKENKIPVFAGKSYDLVELNEFDEAPEVKVAGESLPKIVSAGFDKKDGFSLKGNQLQTKVDGEGNFLGFYYQNGSKKDPLTQFVHPEVLVVDYDPIGHFQADFLKDYGHGSFRCVNSKGQPTEIDDLLAYKGFAGSVTDSRGYYRSSLVRKQIRQEFGQSSLAYLPSGAKLPKDVGVTDQQIAVCRYIYGKGVVIVVKTPEDKVEFDLEEMKDIKGEIQPVLIFDEDDEEVRPLNSDDLLRAGVRKLKVSPLTLQKMLEALYNQKWINYPRANLIKAEDEPIHIIGKDGNALNAEQARERVENEFKGSVQERQLLEIIVKSQEAFEQGENYIVTGSWVLKSGSQEITRSDDVTLFQGETRNFTTDQLEIELGDRGKRIDYVTDFIVKEQLVTPATRSKVLEELVNAGILLQRGDRYTLDKRGLTLVAVDEFYEFKGYERSHVLKREIYEVETEQEVDQIASRFTILSSNGANELREYLVVRTDELMNIEQDLAELDSF